MTVPNIINNNDIETKSIGLDAYYQGKLDELGKYYIYYILIFNILIYLLLIIIKINYY